MAPRNRSSKNKDLPKNLYFQNGYYKYRHPVTKKYFGFGKDKTKAVHAARQLNARFERSDDLSALVVGGLPLADLIDRYQRDRVTSNPKLAETTKIEKGYRLNRIKADKGATVVSTINTKWCADYLSTFAGDAYKQHRSVLKQLIDYAKTIGEWDDINPVDATLSSDPNYEKSRKRLTMEQFKAIHATAEPWFQIAMELALITLQAREEVSAMRYDHIVDDRLRIIRKKTHRKTETAFIAHLITPQLEQVIARSRALPPVCPYIVHYPQSRRYEGNKGHWAQVTPDRLTRVFSDLRDRLPSIAAMPANERPTFHEIRGLGAHMMELAGYDKDKIQAAMGHSEYETTEIYLEGHAVRWSLTEPLSIDL